MNLAIRFLLMIFVNVFGIYIIFKITDFLESKTKIISDKNKEKFSKAKSNNTIYKSSFSTFGFYSFGILFYTNSFVMKGNYTLYKPMNAILFILILAFVFIILDLIILKYALLYRFDNLKTHLSMTLIYGLVLIFFFILENTKFVMENSIFMRIIFFQKYFFGLIFGVFVFTCIWIIFSYLVQNLNGK